MPKRSRATTWLWVIIIVLGMVGGFGILAATGKIGPPGSVFDVPGSGFNLNNNSLGFYAIWAFIASILALGVDILAVYIVLKERHHR